MVRTLQRPEELLDGTRHFRTEPPPAGEQRSATNLIGILSAVRQNDPNVQRVIIEGHTLPSPYILSLLKAVAANNYVSQLRLVNVGMDGSHANEAAECLRRAPVLMLVDWSKNNLDKECCKALSTALRERENDNHVLRKFSLEGNCFSDDGLSYILNAVNEVPTLTTLKVGLQPYSRVGVNHICRFLDEDKSSVSRLDLRGIAMSTTGAALISEALANNKSIERLVISRNNFDSKGAVAFANCLRLNNTLKTLDLQRNKVDDEAAEAFAQMLAENHVFGKVKLRNTLVTEPTKQRLLDLLVMNAHGPDLAQRTKLAYAELVAEQHLNQYMEGNGDCAPPSLAMLDASENSEGSWNNIETEDEDGLCVICFESLDTKPCVILPCRHSNACGNCCSKLHFCHMCRSPIVKIFGTTSSSTKPARRKERSKEI